MLTPKQISALNRGARFLRARTDGEHHCVDLPDGRQVYVYVDPADGVLTVSVRADGHDVRNASLRIKVGNEEPIYEEVTDLPAWEDLTDRDRGAALVHTERAERDGADYAAEFYTPGFEHERLAGLAAGTRARYARQLVQAHCPDLSLASLTDWLGWDEYERLTGLAHKGPPT